MSDISLAYLKPGQTVRKSVEPFCFELTRSKGQYQMTVVRHDIATGNTVTSNNVLSVVRWVRLITGCDIAGAAGGWIIVADDGDTLE